MARPRKVQEDNVVTDTASVQVNEYTEVKLKDKNAKELVVYLPYGYVEFKDGKAMVSQRAKTALKEMGVI